MTRHRLIRSSCSDVLRHASRLGALHPPGSCPGRVVRQWRYREPQVPGRIAWGSAHIPGAGLVSWCLELERGANGVLAHLSAAPAPGPLTELPPVVLRVIMQAWAARELEQLARAVERAVEPSSTPVHR